MKKIIAAAALAFAFSPLSALAQPGGGPGPAPNPWIVNGSTISYSNGCITVPQSVTGGCKGAGTINVQGFYVNGASVAGGVSSVFGRTGAVVAAPGDYAVADVTGAAPLASPTFTGTVTIPNGAALGTPASLTLTSATGLPISTGVSGLGTNVATFLQTPSSTNLAAALTDETGTGSAVFANGPTLIAPVLGTIASGDATALTNIPMANALGVLPAVNGGAGSINGILQGNGSGTVSAITVGSGLSFSGGTLSATGSGVTITPTSGNTANDLVCMQNTTTVIQDCGFSSTAIPTSKLATTLNAQTGAYTIATTDAGTINYLNSASPFTFTVPVAGTLGAGFATDISNASTGLLSATMASGNWADTGNATITTVAGQELFAWVDAAAGGVHSWVSSPPLVAHGIVANNTANKDYGLSFNNSNVTALLAGNLAAVNAANTFSAAQSNCITTLTAVSNVFTPDGTCNNYVLTLGATNTIANWSAGMTPGVSGWIRFNQDATGGRTVGTWGSQINSPGGTSSNTFSSGASAWDTYSYLIYDSTHVWMAPAGLNASH